MSTIVLSVPAEVEITFELFPEVPEGRAARMLAEEAAVAEVRRELNRAVYELGLLGVES